MRIFKDFTFEAAHRLPNVPVEHKCHHLHGHNYRVRVELKGELIQPLGWVQDFAIVKAMTDPMLRQLDHKYLNEVPGLDNPTAEVIAQWLLDRLRLTVLPVSSVTVWETETCGAIAE